MSAQTITSEVVFIPKEVTYYLTFIYAHNTKETKELWSDLVKHNSTYNKPWLIVSDLKLVLKSKIGRVGIL